MANSYKETGKEAEREWLDRSMGERSHDQLGYYAGIGMEGMYNKMC